MLFRLSHDRPHSRPTAYCWRICWWGYIRTWYKIPFNSTLCQLSHWRQSPAPIKLGTKVLNPQLPSSGAWSTAPRTYLPSGELRPCASRDQRPVRYAHASYRDARTQWQSRQLVKHHMFMHNITWIYIHSSASAAVRARKMADRCASTTATRIL